MSILDWLILLFKALWPFRIRPPPHASLEHTPFRKLPLELVICISEFLPPPDAASFTLTCRQIRFILGNQYLDRLWAEGHEHNRVAFLTLFERDLPFYVLCHYCHLLHRVGEERHRTLLWPSYQRMALCTAADYRTHVIGISTKNSTSSHSSRL